MARRDESRRWGARGRRGATAGLLLAVVCSAASAGSLDRGAIVVPSAEGGQLIAWRQLAGDAPGLRFHVERDGRRLTREPVAATQWLDREGGGEIRMIPVGGKPEKALRLGADGLLRIKLDRPADWTAADGSHVPYEANDGAPADLDGDGQFEVVLKWQPTNAKDNSQAGVTAPTMIDAYKLDGTKLWRIDLGRNIRSGAHYTPFAVEDFDGDGRAELMIRTADGAVDGRGQVIGDASADHRNDRGYVLAGPEFISVFDGRTGALLASQPYVPERGGQGEAWGDGYGNRVDRFLAGAAWLDGKLPSGVFSRGYYTRAVIAAWDWRGGKLSQRWVFDSNEKGSEPAFGQGAHWFSVADVDGDGKQDIVYGAATISSAGKLLYSTGLGHGDALHVGKLDPTRDGLQIFMVHESLKSYGEHGIEMHDAATGKILWSHPGDRKDIGRGVCMDIDPWHAGSECWASAGPLFNARGEIISETKPRSVNFASWWDGDLLRESLDRTTIAKWNPATGKLEPLLEAGPLGAASNNGTKATPVFSADILGDWREEVVWRSSDNRELLIASSPLPTPHRFTTLMQDRQYRAQVASQNAGYNQPPHPSFHIGP